MIPAQVGARTARRDPARVLFVAGMLLPGLLLYSSLVLLPMAEAFRLALYRWRGVSGRMVFVGAENFQRLIQDHRFLQAVGHNLQFLLLTAAVILPLALFFANALQQPPTPVRRQLFGAGFYRALFLFPNVLSMVAVSLLWMFLYNTNWGLVNAVLARLGALPEGGGVEWLANSRTVLPAVAATFTWYVLGFYVLLLRAGMQNIGTEVVEAAIVDGCGDWTLFSRITLPLIEGVLRLVAVYLLINAMNLFALVWVMAPPSGTAGATEVSLTYLYQKGFVEQEFGYASAIGACNFVFVMFVSALIQRGRRVPA